MSLRLNGSVLGKRNVPTATLATGAWSLRAQSLYRRDNIWPRRDPDAVAFAAASGATDIDAISDFAKGVKRLGLWSNMVCWPLRSTQNAGTGTTAYSLGGLGTFNGTLTNGPTWGVDGVTFDGVDDRIVNSALTDGGGGTLFSVAFTAVAAAAGVEGRMVSFTSGLELGHTRNSATIYGAEAFYLAAPFNGVGRTTNPSPAASTLSRWFTACGVFNNNSSISRFVDGTAKVSASIATTYLSQTGIRIGGRSNNTLYWDGPIAAVAYFPSLLSDSQAALLHSLYRDTLGTGLGLP